MRKPNPSAITDALLSALLPSNSASQTADQVKYHDVILQTSDNYEIPALKPILALRSPFFSRLFFTPFSESTSPTVAVDLTQKSLIQVLHFIYSDESPTLRRLDDAIRRSYAGPKQRRKAWAALRCRDIEAAVTIIAAADYCQINVLAEWGCSLIMKAIRVKQGLACIALQAIIERGGICSKLAEVREVLLNYIVRYAPGCFASPYGEGDEGRPLAVRECFGYGGKCAILHLGEDALKLVFKRMRKEGSEFLSTAVIFDSLHFWGTGGTTLAEVKKRRENNPNGVKDLELKRKDEKSGKSLENANAKDQGPTKKVLSEMIAANDPKDTKCQHNTGEKTVRRGETDKQSSRWKAAMFCAGMMHAPSSSIFLVSVLEPSGLLAPEVLFRFYRDVARYTAVLELEERHVAAVAAEGSDGENELEDEEHQ